jgi:uncharacterized protein YjbI with pentapeptide repeats
MLSGANLSHANLSHANLSHANLSHASLSEANLSEVDFSRANLSGADLSSASLIKAYLKEADLSGANLSDAFLNEANLFRADLRGADLRGAELSRVDLTGANLGAADLTGANLTLATMIDVGLHGAKLSDCKIFGISVWNAKTDEHTEQKNLIVSNYGDPVLTVDNLEVAQFIYLLLNNAKIRDVIDTITSKVVLILGRFTPERKAVLDALREQLRLHNYLPVMFDFDKSASQGYTDTITTLARMARFIVADLTDATEVRLELSKIVPELPSVPVQPLLLASAKLYVTFQDIARYSWVLPLFRYNDLDHAIASLPSMVLAPVEAKLKEIAMKLQELQTTLKELGN